MSPANTTIFGGHLEKRLTDLDDEVQVYSLQMGSVCLTWQHVRYSQSQALPGTY
jgi:hypothetical protein